MAAALSDWQTAPVRDEVRAMLGFLTKFVPPEESFGAEDIMALRAAGLSTEAIRDAMYASWAFQNLSRWMDAFGFPIHTPRLLRIAAPMLWKLGYKLPIR